MEARHSSPPLAARMEAKKRLLVLLESEDDVKIVPEVTPSESIETEVRKE